MRPMINDTTRHRAVLVSWIFIATMLTGCGGESLGTGNGFNTYSVGGTVEAFGWSTADEPVLTLASHGDEIDIDSPGDFQFSEQLEDGGEYNVEITDFPSDLACSVHDGEGTIDGADVDDVEVECEAVGPQDD